LVSLVSIAVLIFGATVVLAQVEDPLPQECTAKILPHWDIDVRTVGVYPDEKNDGYYDGEYALFQCKDYNLDNELVDVPCYVWEINLEGKFTPPSLGKWAEFFIPISEGIEPHKIVGAVGLYGENQDNFIKIHDPCEGGINGWMKGVCSGFVVSVKTINADAGSDSSDLEGSNSCWLCPPPMSNKRAVIATSSGVSGVVGLNVKGKLLPHDCIAKEGRLVVGGIAGPGYESVDPVSESIHFSRKADGKVCSMRVNLAPTFFIDELSGDCRLSEIYDINTLSLETPPPVDNGSGDAISSFAEQGHKTTAIDLPEGWFSYHGSPATYCYYNKARRKYQCVTY